MLIIIIICASKATCREIESQPGTMPIALEVGFYSIQKYRGISEIRFLTPNSTKRLKFFVSEGWRRKLPFGPNFLGNGAS